MRSRSVLIIVAALGAGALSTACTGDDRESSATDAAVATDAPPMPPTDGASPTTDGGPAPECTMDLPLPGGGTMYCIDGRFEECRGDTAPELTGDLAAAMLEAGFKTEVGAFQTYADGAEVELIVGPQGGFMIPLFTRLTGVDAARDRILLSLTSHHVADPSVAIPESNFDCVPFSRDASGAWLSERGHNDLLTFDPTGLEGVTIGFSVEAALGTDARATTPVANLVLHYPPR